MLKKPGHTRHTCHHIHCTCDQRGDQPSTYQQVLIGATSNEQVPTSNRTTCTCTCCTCTCSYGCTAVPCLPRAQCQCNGSRTCHMTNEWALGSDTSVAVWAQTAERRNKKTCTPPPAANQRLPSSEQSESPSDGTKCCQLAAVHPKHVCKHLPRPPVSKWRAHLRHHPLPFARVAVPTKLAACGSDHLLPLCTTSAR